MIAYLEGRLLAKTESSCVVATEGGVGYEVFVPAHVQSGLPAVGEFVSAYVHTVVREDALELYGFESWDERQTFGILISISKLGPKTGLAILSVFRPDDLRRLVLDEDVQALTRVSGIGKKTAQHIFLELKYKLKIEDTIASKASGGASAASAFRDVMDGLLGLGYSEDEVASVVEKLFKEEPDLDVSSGIRAALKNLAKVS